MDKLLTCKCGEVVVKSLNGTTKVRNKILVFRKGVGYAICKGCGVELPVPIALMDTDDGRRPRLFVSELRRVGGRGIDK